MTSLPMPSSLETLNSILMWITWQLATIMTQAAPPALTCDTLIRYRYPSWSIATVSLVRLKILSAIMSMALCSNSILYNAINGLRSQYFASIGTASASTFANSVQVQHMKLIHDIQPLGWKRYQISKSKETILS
jgi:hypothetical protein